VTSFIPVLIAVLLAEVGGRSAVFAHLPRLSLAAITLGLAVGAAAVAGWTIAPTMTPHARALMLGLALLIAAYGQLGKSPSGDPPDTVWATVLLVSRTNVPFLAFAFAIWKSDPFGAAAGALAGFVGAVVLGTVMPTSGAIRARLSSAAVIGIFGAYQVLWALRLVA
jgi:Ca2+/H+ antiporter, TMEM165/GDT1 family